jgi:hypothetical protein
LPRCLNGQRLQRLVLHEGLANERSCGLTTVRNSLGKLNSNARFGQLTAPDICIPS